MRRLSLAGCALGLLMLAGCGSSETPSGGVGAHRPTGTFVSTTGTRATTGTTGSTGTTGTTGTTGASGTTGTTGTTGATGALTISISNLTFSPSNLNVPAGGTVTVMNMDNMPHSVTSQSAQDQYTLGSVAGVSFDTGILQPGQQATFTIPSSAPVGTVIPYFCRVHLGAMRNDAQITVQASAP